MKKDISTIFLFLLTVNCFAAKIPAWYQNKEVAYPSDFYITAIGEGKTKEEAEIKAIASISLYFQTTTDVCNTLVKNYNEFEKGDIYKLTKYSSINEKSKITSNAEFFGVQFAQGFIVDGSYTTLAFIDREGAFSVYEQRIKNNTSIIESLLLTAEDYNNPIFGFEAAKLAIPVAEMNTQLLKMARLTKKVSENYFEKDDSYIQRVYSAYEICKNNRVFYISVPNDYQGMVKRTISDLLEKQGYNVSSVNGICEIPVDITMTEDETETAFFVYGGLVINVTTGTGEVIFSYSRNFPKKGGKTKDMAYKRAFQDIEKELKASFVSEFNSKIKAN